MILQSRNPQLRDSFFSPLFPMPRLTGAAAKDLGMVGRQVKSRLGLVLASDLGLSLGA